MFTIACMWLQQKCSKHTSMLLDARNEKYISRVKVPNPWHRWWARFRVIHRRSRNLLLRPGGSAAGPRRLPRCLRSQVLSTSLRRRGLLSMDGDRAERDGSQHERRRRLLFCCGLMWGLGLVETFVHPVLEHVFCCLDFEALLVFPICPCSCKGNNDVVKLIQQLPESLSAHGCSLIKICCWICSHVKTTNHNFYHGCSLQFCCWQWILVYLGKPIDKKIMQVNSFCSLEQNIVVLISIALWIYSILSLLQVSWIGKGSKKATSKWCRNKLKIGVWMLFWILALPC